MVEPDVTVVIPVYNAMPYLRECLDSLVRQTVAPGRLQVVAVDDGATDGSGELLDEYAARHPGFVEVVHQPNSGGPARPCNVGLGLARGRFVFFLGADDFLGDEALERLVAAADRWDSDIVCGRTIGLNGRVVLQQLYTETVEDVPFPSPVLTHAVSNTKLFRRSMLLEHGIDYPLELRVGSDQPFTIKAMRHARKISVLADYDYYHGVKRDDLTNLTYSTGWRQRRDCIAAVMDWVAEEFEPGETRDTVLHRHFSSELSKILRRDFAEVEPAEQEEMVAGIAVLVDAHLTPAIERDLIVLRRLRLRLAAAGRLDELRALIGAEDAPTPRMIMAPDSVVLAFPGYGTLPEPWFTVTANDPVARLLHRGVHEGSLVLSGTRMQVAVDTPLAAESAPAARVVLVLASDGRSKPARRAGSGPRPRWMSDPVQIDEHGRLTATLDLAGVIPREPGAWALRLHVESGSERYTVPVPLTSTTEVTVRRWLRRVALTIRPDAHGRALVEVRGRS